MLLQQPGLRARLLASVGVAGGHPAFGGRPVRLVWSERCKSWLSAGDVLTDLPGPSDSSSRPQCYELLLSYAATGNADLRGAAALLARGGGDRSGAHGSMPARASRRGPRVHDVWHSAHRAVPALRRGTGVRRCHDEPRLLLGWSGEGGGRPGIRRLSRVRRRRPRTRREQHRRLGMEDRLPQLRLENEAGRRP